jgi:hypothetical protein
LTLPLTHPLILRLATPVDLPNQLRRQQDILAPIRLPPALRPGSQTIARPNRRVVLAVHPPRTDISPAEDAVGKGRVCADGPTAR